MKINKSDLQNAASHKIISSEQVESLWSFLNKKSEDHPRFSLGHVIYYLGGLIVIGSMTWFMVKAWEQLGGLGISFVSLLMALGFFLTGKSLWSKDALKIPGGILVTAAVSITPLIVYGIQKHFGFWSGGTPTSYGEYHSWIQSNWIYMELTTIAVGIIALYKIRFPFVTFPIALALWYLSMDVAALLLGEAYYSYDMKKMISVIFGSLMLLGTYFIDRRTKEDFAFWGYLFGLLAFWGGLSLMTSTSELNKFIYCLLNLGLIFLSVFLSRKAFIVFGSLGVFGYMAHLADKVFKDSLIFPLAMSLLGVFVIFLGIKYQKNKDLIEKWVLSVLPESVKDLRPSERK